MPGSEALSTIAEISIGLAGFTGIAALFGRVRHDPLLRMRLAALLFSTFGPLVMCLLPFILTAFKLPDAQVWYIGNCVLFPYGVGMLLFLTPRIRKLRRDPENALKASALWVGYGLPILSSVAGLAGLGTPDLGMGYFISGQVLILTGGIFMFGRILFASPDREDSARET